jgi:predicted CXXCH cytochrome family protein
LKGKASLGTDLSDDHPISFVYDSVLALKQGELADPTTLPSGIRLDDSQQLQCTACHNPHDDPYRKFLRVDDRLGALCTACHRPSRWIGSAHATSSATWGGTGINPWPDSPYGSVAENACQSCHQPHAAPHPPRLLGNSEERTVCLVCHNGKVTTKNIESEFSKFSVHPIDSSNWTHEPTENPASMPRHVTCTDCHNPHQAAAAAATAPFVSGNLEGVRGVNLSGAELPKATMEYEVCLKCHGIQDPNTIGIIRQDNLRNIRLKINPNNPSYHPVASAGRNTSVEGFETGYTTASIIYCTDCHNNDEWTSAGTNPRGPHGSSYWPILEREYQSNDPSQESFQQYELCYKCHNRDFLINDRANTFLHKKHVQDNQTSCAVCHDAHGSQENVGLINFMLQDRTGKTVVSPSQSQNRLEFISTGTGGGQCYLLCHGKNHEPESYP